MKANINTPVKPCPFCGGSVCVTHGLINAPYFFFKCRQCGAIVSFDNDECNATPSKAKEYFERRVDNERRKAN